MKINNKVEEGEAKISTFVRGLVERAGVKEEEREAEEARLKDVVVEKILNEVLMSLPDEDLTELEEALKESEDLPVEKWNSMMFMEGIKPESVVGKVFREVEREYLGAENMEEENE